MSNIENLDWQEIQQQATDILSRYIRIDTTNPPGNESKAATFLSELLSEEGVESKIYESAPGRANLVAKLTAPEKTSPPLLLMHHMDVVPAANAEQWTHPPFDGVVQDEYIWGRGALDDKGLGTIQLMAFLLLKRLQVPLKRDVIFMAVSDEEEGGTQGAQWMLENHWPEIECEYVWDEGGTGTQGIMGNRPIFSISVWEKRSVVVRLVATGQGGHGSMASGSALDRLIMALGALQDHRFDVRFNSVSRQFFQTISKVQPSLAGLLMRHAELPIISKFINGQVSKIPSINAMLRDTLTATIVHAGDKANVAPDIAEATLDARLLPDTEQEIFLSEIRSVINDDSVTVEATDSPISPPPSPANSAMFSVLEEVIKEQVPDAIVTPIQTPVATDSRFFRERGINAYGLIPVVLTPDELRTIHGTNERISLQQLTQGIQIALESLTRLCG